MKSLLRVVSYLKPFRGLALVTLLFAALATGLELIPPYFLKVVIDDVIEAHRPDLLPWVLGGLATSYLLRTVCSSLRVRFNNSLEQKAVHTLRTQVFAALQRLSLSYFENRSTGEIMTRVTSDTEHFRGRPRGIADGVTDAGRHYDHLVCVELEARALVHAPHSSSDRLRELVYETCPRVLSRYSKKRRQSERLSPGCPIGHQRDHRF